MSTERFTKEQFEAVLATFCQEHGTAIVGNRFTFEEYRYQMEIAKLSRPNGGGDETILIEIASSVGPDGLADAAGDNSIRLYLTNGDGMPVGNKLQKWVTRVPGWETRLTDMLMKLCEMGRLITFCDRCQSLRKIFIVKKDGNNKGRLFMRCNCEHSFKWLDDIEDEEPSKPEKLFRGTYHMPTAVEKVEIPKQSSFIDVQSVEKPKKFIPSKYQLAVFDYVHNMEGGQHLVVEACAGSGKTTTGVKMMELIPRTKDVIFIAFNKHIERKLSEVAPSHVRVRTYHGLGFAICRSTYGGTIKVDDDKVRSILTSFLDKDKDGYLFPVIGKLVSLVKNTLSDVANEDLADIADHYGIEIDNFDEETIYDAVRYVVAKSATMTNVVDFDDMCWLPVVNKLTAHQYDLAFVDEAQDTNKCQIALALMSIKPNGNIIAVGDRHQSLYGFRGADVDAIPNLIENLNAKTLPLSISYRNPREVVRIVNERFPDFPLEAAEWAVDGAIRYLSDERALAEYAPGDMVLCRVNAKLVAPAFALIRNGIKATIRGRDIGKGLIALIRKMKVDDLGGLLAKLSEYKRLEMFKLLESNKNSQAQALEDKVDTIIALSDGVTSVYELEIRVDDIFSDDTEGVVFSSVHRAKGLEAKRIFILAPELMPHPMAKKSWEIEQERNVEYVALTRSLSELIFVS